MATPKKAWTYLDMTEDERRAFADRLRAFRKQHSLTQERLSAALGLHRTTIMSLENGLNRPFPSTLVKLAELEEKYEREAEREMEDLLGLS